ncbi:MAG: hypothetical protein IKO39_04355 [Treponema sp.]|nr:hypothetical protein [Treponema sp.]
MTDLNIGGAVEDNASGVVSASITLKGEGINQNIIVNLVDSDSDGKKDSWTATISAKDNLSDLVSGKTYNVNATVTDAAGNSSASTIFTLQVDKVAPGVKMTTPVAGSTLNGTISVSGTVPAADIGAIPAKLELYWSATAPVSSSTDVEGTELSDFTKAGEIPDASSIYSWTFDNLNTYLVFGSDIDTARKDIYLIPVLYDEAGNCNVYKESLKENYESLDENEAITEKKYSYTEGTNFFKYTVDRNSDRPIINITSIDSEGDWLGNATLKGTITDDDGISAFYISNSSTFQETDKVTVSNGTWSYNLGTDGTKSLYFKVVDSQNKTFTTGDTSKFSRPYYLYSGTLASEYAGTTETPTYEYGLDNNAAIPVKLDTASPKMSTLGLTIGSNYNDYVAEGDNANLNGHYTVTQIAADTSASDKIFGSSRNAGGNSKYIRIYVPAYDSNISRVTVKIKDSDGNNQTDTFKTVNETTGTSSEITKTTDTSGVDTTVITLTRTSINSSETVPDTTSEKFTYYESPVLDVSSVSTGTKTVEISVTDLAGNETKENKQFTVDNNGPDNITITSPAPTDEVTGTIKVVGTASDTGSGIDTIAWMVPPIAQKKAVTVTDKTADDYISDKDLIVLSGWNETTTTGVFNFQFLSNSTTDLTLFEPSREDYADETKYNYAVTYNSDKQTFTIPLFIKTVDKLGNVFIKRDYSITHNPDADRPVTAMGYPTANDYDSGNNYKTLSGVIRVNGTVEIPSGTTNVGQVFIQIGKVTYDAEGKASVDWANYSTNFADEISDLGGVVRPVTTGGKTTITVPGANNSSTTYLNTSYVDSSWWGIPVTTKTSTWNVSLNSKSHLNPTESGSPRKIAIRACAINADGKMGLWTDSTIDPVYIHVDNGAPSQSAVMRQYQFGENEILSDANAENAEKISLQKDYTAEMYLKKTWYLVATLTDDESINSSSILVKQGSANKTSECVITGSGKTYKVYIPIETENMTSSYVNYTVSVDDNSTPAHSSTMTYNFSIDNDAPEISKVFRGASLAEDESNIISENEDIEDSNYIYTLAGKVNETGSGYDKVVFYYVRDGEKSAGGNYTTPAVLDPFITTNQNDAKAVIESDGLTPINVNGNSGIKLYGKSLTDGTTAAVPDTDGSYTFDQSSIAGNAHIRKGGLIYIGGEYGKITEKSGSKVTFTINASVATTTTSAFFPYAQVVDNTGMETVSKQTGKDFEFSSQNEDDGMPETIEGSKAVGFIWTATMHTTNIPDGPAKLVILAFDKAGNVSQISRNISIVNNRPRLAKVFLGTDLNSNNVWATDEFVGYNLYAANEGAGITVTEVKEKQSIATAKYDENSSPFQIKDKLAVISEFVGGNGEISMVYKKGATTTDAVSSSGTGAGTVASANATITSLIVTDDKVGSVTYHSNATSTSLMGFTLTSKEVAGLAANATLSAANGNVSGVNASFTFWDSTDEGASQSCVLQISDLTLDLVDTVNPKVVVNPFYWDSASSNSLYNNSKDNGHIELEGDLPTATFTGTSGEFDLDPKVSGKITFTGTAYDDHTLGSLKFTLSRPVTANNKTTETAYEGFEDVAMATYDPASTATAYVENDGWSRLSGNSGSSVANGGKYEWTISRSSTTEDINARKYGDSCYLSQEGHKIYWTITIDTEQISDVAAKDVKLTVTATDKSNLASTGATVTSSSPATGKTDAKVNHVPVYQMDVVPYITKVYTRISKNAGEEFARSATGRYSLNQAETFRLFGFNLDKTTANNEETVKTTVTFTADGATNGTALAVTLPENTDTEDKEILDNTALGSHIKVSAANITTKGSLKLTVNGVSSLNNDNAEPAFTENDRKAYNSQANGITNNLLNDDVKIYLWTTGVFDTVMRGHGANVTSPMMKFDTSGNYYISYGQGAKLFAINKYDTNNKSNTDTTLESCYNKYHNTNVAFDGSGNFYGVATDTDRIDVSRDRATSFTFFSQALGYSLENNAGMANNAHDYGNYSNGTNKRRLELSQYGGNDGTYNINRVQRPKLTVSGSGTSTAPAKVYMAYYDASANNVKFRYGTVTGEEDMNGNQWDGYTRTSKMSGGIANDLTGNGTENSSAAGYHLIATNSTTYKGGAYTAVGYASNGDAVVAWYDASNRQLVFSYNTAANIAKTTFWNGSPNTETRTAQAAWQDNAVVIDSDYAGWYVDLAVDSDNGVHIAYYKSSSGDLKYAYISDYTKAAETKQVVTVDSYLSVGTNITINLKDKVPYIYYYNTSANQTTNSIKVAWQNGTLGNGAENDKFTGKWECMTIPTSNIPNDATVSGGVPTAGTYNGEVVLGYMTDLYFEKAELK